MIGRSDAPGKKVVVVGAGPGGLEAARVSAARGHHVVLFEASSELGGQMVLAAKATWRQGLSGIAAWYGAELDRLGVEVRLNRFAEAQDVLDEAPGVVVIATGGLPNVGHADGADLVTTTWDLLSGAAAPGQDILLFDENGGHPGLSCAEFAASHGAKVGIVTPHKALGTELGGTNLGAHMSELYKLGVTVRPDSRLTAVTRAGNKLAATVANTYSGAIENVLVDQVVGEHGSLPNADLYFSLKPMSRNLGEVDLRAMADDEPQTIDANPGRHLPAVPHR